MDVCFTLGGPVLLMSQHCGANSQSAVAHVGMHIDAIDTGHLGQPLIETDVCKTPSREDKMAFTNLGHRVSHVIGNHVLEAFLRCRSYVFTSVSGPRPAEVI